MIDNNGVVVNKTSLNFPRLYPLLDYLNDMQADLHFFKYLSQALGDTEARHLLQNITLKHPETSVRTNPGKNLRT